MFRAVIFMFHPFSGISHSWKIQPRPKEMEGKARGTILVEFDKLGSLSSDDGNGNENCKKAIGLDNKTTNMHLHHRPFLYIYLPSLQDTT